MPYCFMKLPGMAKLKKKKNLGPARILENLDPLIKKGESKY